MCDNAMYNLLISVFQQCVLNKIVWDYNFLADFVLKNDVKCDLGLGLGHFQYRNVCNFQC